MSVSPPGRLLALWAVPRSMSTTLEKTFSCRADTRVVHEPFTDCYYFGNERRSRRYGDRPDRSTYSTADALASIFAETTQITFMKELCFQAEPYVPEAFLERMLNTFIVCHPDTVLPSLVPLKPDFTEDEFGFIPLAKMWHRIVGQLGHEPIVIDGDAFRAQPEEVLRRYCERVGVQFERSMLQWQDGKIRKWSDGEQESQAKWHHTLENSKGILPPAQAKPEVPVSVPVSVPLDAYSRAKEIYAMVSEHAIC